MRLNSFLSKPGTRPSSYSRSPLPLLIRSRFERYLGYLGLDLELKRLELSWPVYGQSTVVPLLSSVFRANQWWSRQRRRRRSSSSPTGLYVISPWWYPPLSVMMNAVSNDGLGVAMARDSEAESGSEANSNHPNHFNCNQARTFALFSCANID